MHRASIALLALSVFGFIVAGLEGQQSPAAKECFAKAESQMAMNRCAGAEADAAESELNRVYQTILKKYADSPVFIQRLREAQRAWLRYREAQIAMRFPIAAAEKAPASYGSVYPMCVATYQARLTRLRTQELQEWLTGLPEGEVCSGSVRTPDSLK